MVQVHVLFFAALREAAGSREVQLTLPDGACVADLRAELARTLPALAPLLTHAAVAINQDYAESTAPLHSHDVVALIPPVSGGGS